MVLLGVIWRTNDVFLLVFGEINFFGGIFGNNDRLCWVH